jgi:RNA polymerase sigma-70 factor (ECF subfamily)
MNRDANQVGNSFSTSSLNTSLTLLQRVQAHDCEAWSRLVNVYAPLVYDWCRHQGLQSADVADIVQEVFRSLWQKIATFHRDRPGDSFRGWLWSITRSRIYDHYRSLAKQANAAGGSTANLRLQQISDHEPQDAGGSRISLEPLRRALEYIRPEFRDNTWEAFLRAVLTRQPTVDIAEELGISVNAVRKAKSRVLRRLREEFGDLV